MVLVYVHDCVSVDVGNCGSVSVSVSVNDSVSTSVSVSVNVSVSTSVSTSVSVSAYLQNWDIRVWHEVPELKTAAVPSCSRVFGVSVSTRVLVLTCVLALV